MKRRIVKAHTPISYVSLWVAVPPEERVLDARDWPIVVGARVLVEARKWRGVQLSAFWIDVVALKRDTRGVFVIGRDDDGITRYARQNQCVVVRRGGQRALAWKRRQEVLAALPGDKR